MSIIRALINFRKLNNTAFLEKAGFVYKSMNNNPDFPNPPIPMAELLVSTQTFNDLLLESKSKDVIKVSKRNDARKVVDTQLRALAAFVNFTGQEDRSKILGSGFSVTSNSQRGGTMIAPTNFTVTLGENSGEVILSCDSVPQAKSFVFLWTPSPANGAAWFHVVGSSSSHVITNLTKLAEYDFKIAIGGKKDQVVYTDVITKVVV